MMHRSLLLVLWTAAVLSPALAGAEERGGAARAGHPSDATAPDPFPNACVDCHLNYVDRKMDVRLSTLMAGWREKVDPKLLANAQAAAPAGAKLEGKHPEASGALASIPGRCLTCHQQRSSRAPAFAQLIHSIHLTGGAQNHFIANFQGKCTHCHKLDSTTGAVRVPSAAER